MLTNLDNFIKNFHLLICSEQLQEHLGIAYYQQQADYKMDIELDDKNKKIVWRVKQ